MNKRTYILLGILGLVLLVAAYVSLGAEKNPQSTGAPGLASGGDSSPSVLGPETVTGQKFLAMLLRLKELNISRDIFDNPTFQTLEDYTVALDPQVAGRSNPFASLGEGGVYAPPLSTTGEDGADGQDQSAGAAGARGAGFTGGARSAAGAEGGTNTQTQAGSGF